MTLFAVCLDLMSALQNWRKPSTRSAASKPKPPQRLPSGRQVVTSMQPTEWPPVYTVRRHSRARHVKLAYSTAHGLRITLPTRFSAKHLPSILEEHKDWIIRQTSLYAPQKQSAVRPADIHFQAFAQQWTVHYFQSDKSPRIKQFNNDGIILSGDIKEFDVCRDKLSRWIKKQAKLLLIPYFENLAEELGLPFHDVTIRSQSTLWGSCSQDKSIRLNYKLLFLPAHLMRHIMIHELCHTRHMNHSEKFWQLVASFDHNWIINKKAMKSADKHMPAWL